MMSALCKMQTVSFGRLTLAFGGAAEASSNMRRMQRFMSGYAHALSLIAWLIFRLLPHQEPYTLFRKDSIDSLVADRESVETDWLAYLNVRRIRYHIRIRENFRATKPSSRSRFKAS